MMLLISLKVKLKKNQVFWVCPLIKESKKIDHQSATEKYKYLRKIFNDKVDIVHGSMSKEEKDKVLNKFNDRKIDILVSTTVIEVGIDFPNANVIVIENSNKYGLSQLTSIERSRWKRQQRVIVYTHV